MMLHRAPLVICLLLLPSTLAKLGGPRQLLRWPTKKKDKVQDKFPDNAPANHESTLGVDAVIANGGVTTRSITNPAPIDFTQVWLEILFDNFPEETGWSIVDENDNVVESRPEGYYGRHFHDHDTAYELLDMDPGDYTFHLTDSQGDGIVNGTYKLEVKNGLPLASPILASGSGVFTSRTSQDFTVPAPNPQGKIPLQIKVNFDYYPHETGYHIHDEVNNIEILDRAYETFRGHTDPITDIFYLDPGDYVFIIRDSFHDGICCAYGNGNYEVFVETMPTTGSIAVKNILGSGNGRFVWWERHEITV